MPCLEPGGHVQKTAVGLCTITAPQLCRRTGAPGTSEAGGVLRVGESGVLAGEGGGVPEAGALRRRGAAARRGTTVAHRGGMAAVTAGPGRRRGPGAAAGATFPSTGDSGAGRPEKCGPGAGRRDNHKPAAAVET